MLLLSAFSLSGRPALGAANLKDLELHTIEVYEGDTHKNGKVQVIVTTTDRPLMIRLRDYENGSSRSHKGSRSRKSS